ncbi:MAG: phosphate ABC transporter permease subunit PstC [Chloroflexi bacterium]|nr:phosphate ABC transporter permease subunit PstC [Chloroflexota bacterium]
MTVHLEPDSNIPNQRLAKQLPVHWREFAIESLIRVAGVSTIGFVALILAFLLLEGAPAFWQTSWRVLLGQRWYPIFGIYGILPLVLGSLLVTAGAVVIAVPLGLATAIFVAEIAPRWLREILKPLIEVIAGVPSVVLGFLGMVAVAPLIRQELGIPTGLTALTGSLMLAYMALPTIITIAEDALDAVPTTYRDGAYALGATQWQTIWRVIVPAARSGILVAIMLGIGRVVGETMAVMMVTGNAARMPMELDAILRPVRTMTATIAAEMGEVARGSTHYHVLFVIGLVLFVLTFIVNAIASLLTIGARERRGGRLMR